MTRAKSHNSTATYGLVLLRRGRDRHVLRFDLHDSLAAYAALEGLLRDGLICQCEFGFAVQAVTRQALAAKDGTA